MDPRPPRPEVMTVPHDRTLTEALAELAEAGYDRDLMPVEGGRVRCLTCREVHGAEVLHADRAARLEGASDPADMAIVVPGTCPACGSRGTVVCHFGPEAGEAESDLVAALPRIPAVPFDAPGGSADRR